MWISNLQEIGLIICTVRMLNDITYLRLQKNLDNNTLNHMLNDNRIVSNSIQPLKWKLTTGKQPVHF
jgi:hypothetical protein